MMPAGPGRVGVQQGRMQLEGPRRRSYARRRRHKGTRPGGQVVTWARPTQSLSKDALPGEHAVAPVPRVLMQTWHRPLEDLPQRVAAGIRMCSQGLSHEYFRDSQCKEFLYTNYGPQHVAKFDQLRCGAHKADFFRYCYLYIEGGVYMDVDLEPRQTLVSILAGIAPGTLVTCLDASRSGIFQAFIATPPGHPVFPELINRFFAPDVESGFFTYDTFTRHMGSVLRRRKGRPLRTGMQTMLDGSRLCLLYENQRGIRGSYDVFHRGKRVFSSRYTEYMGGGVDAGTSFFSN